jgi:biotin carboxylase
MKKTLKLLASSSLIALTLSIFRESQGMEMDNNSFGISSAKTTSLIEETQNTEQHHLVSYKSNCQIDGRINNMEKIVFIETNPTFSKSISFAKQLGYSPVLFTRIKTHNPYYYAESEINAFDVIYNVDTHDANTMLKLIKNNSLVIKGVVTCYDDTVLPAAYLAEELALPHPSIEGLQNTYFKDNVRKILSSKGIIQLEYATINLAEVPNNPPIRFPFVIKPAHDCGADGVHLCKTVEDYSTMMESLKSNPFTFSGLTRNKILLEEFISGSFYGAELLWNNNAWKILGINKLFVDPEKSLCMVGISFPSDIHETVLATVQQEILEWVDTLELKGGALNVEFKLVENKPVLIEINPRLAGSKVNRLMELALGISPIEHLIKQACKIESNVDEVILKNDLHFADAFIFPPACGEIKSIDTSSIPTENLIQIDLKEPPFFIQSNKQIFDNIIGHVIALGTNCNDAMINAQAIINKMKVYYM